MSTGKVKWFNEEKRFGFIQPDDGGNDLFVHASAVEGGVLLQENTAVQFDSEQGQKGPKAVNVRVI